MTVGYWWTCYENDEKLKDVGFKVIAALVWTNVVLELAIAHLQLGREFMDKHVGEGEEE